MSNDLERKKIIEKYWLNRLSGDFPALRLPMFHQDIIDGDKIEKEEAATGPLSLPIPDATMEGLNKIGNNSPVAVFILAQALLNILLHRITRVEDILVGTVSPKKPGEKAKLLFCRNRVSSEFTVKDTLNQVKQTVLEAFNYSDYSFGLLFQKLQEKQEDRPLELFNIAFIYDKIQDKSKQLKQFPLLLTLSAGEDSTRLTMEYREDLYSEGTVLRFGQNFVFLLGQLAQLLEQKIDTVDILSPQEKNQLECFNRWYEDIDAPSADGDTLHFWFEAQVEKTPGNIALTGPDGGPEITYQELNQRANRLAHLLREKGIGPDMVVGLMMERSIEMVVAQLAVLKAGGAYLPIDPEAPANRVSSMLNDCRASLLITQNTVTRTYSYTLLQGLRTNGVEPVLTTARERVTDFDSLPIPDRSLLDCEKYHRYLGQAVVKNRIVIQASRGCPHDCSYCYRIWPRKQMARTGENLFSEVKMYYDIGIRKFDIFMMNIKEGKRLFQLIIQNKMNHDIQLFFPNGFRGDLLTREYVDLMVEAGTVNFALALETASPRLQKLINKHLNLERFRATAEYVCEKYPHVILELFTLHGIPSETEEDARLTLDFIKSLKWVHFPYVNVLKIYHNTGMEKLALANGISREAIDRSENMAWHELSDTLPFNREFSSGYQAEFLSQYVLNKERLLQVLPHQVNILTEEELVKKYDSYLPSDIATFDHLLEFAGLTREELGTVSFVDEKIDQKILEGLNERIRGLFPVKETSENGLRVLMLDLSQFFTNEADMLYDVVDPPLGLLYILTYLKDQLGDKVNGKLLKSRLDFDGMDELKTLLEEFKPQVLGVRTLSYYADFFHETIAAIRQWGFDGPIVTGGPHVTVDYNYVLQDRNIDVAVLSEGEITFYEIINAIIDNGGQLPDEAVLSRIPGIAYLPRELSPSGYAREIINLDRCEETLSRLPGTNLNPVNEPGDLAYIIFTSGSTGKPKGVLVEHQGAVNVLRWFGHTYDLQPGVNVIQLSSYTFDPSVEQIFGTLVHGGHVFLTHKALIADLEGFRQFMRDNDIHIINFVPGTLKELLGSGERLPELRAVISGGEKLDEPIKTFLLEKGYPLTNQYGPTETTIDVLMDRCNKGGVTLGRPVFNARCFVLDAHDRPVPIGVVGELAIAGAGVTRGYLNNPDLTREKFALASTGLGERFYRTGDRARWLPDGRIQFMGRSDHQVKVRGYRIELGEIESQLLNHHAVEQAVVEAVEGEMGDKYLMAYIVALQDVGHQDLRDFLGWELPDYMIPARFIQLEKMPRTATGKVDRRALSDLKDSESAGTAEYEAPCSENELALAEVWQKVLGKEKIGIHDNFFTIGGDSIKSIQIASRLNTDGYKLEMKDLFQNPTISRLAPLVTKVRQVADQSAVIGVVPLTPVQARFFSDLPQDHHHYNQAMMLQLDGGIGEEAVRSIFHHLQQHHDALRMYYETRPSGEVVQSTHGPDLPVDLTVFRLRDMEDNAAAEEAFKKGLQKIQTGISLEKGPLMKLGLYHMKDGDYLQVVVHHLAVDGISWRLLFEDIDTLRRRYAEGAPLELPPKTGSFKEWSEKLSRYADSPDFLKEKTWWRGQEEAEVPLIPVDSEGGNYMDDVRQVGFRLTPEETDRLLTKANIAFGTEINDILLTALGLAVKDTWGHSRLLVAMEGHGREEILENIDISRTLGWFTSVYPVLIDVSFGDDLARHIKENKDHFRRLPNKGIGYGILRYLTAPGNKSDVTFKLEPQIAFNYLGQFDQDMTDRSFKVGGRSSGRSYSPRSQREVLLDVSGMVAGGQLGMSVAYSHNQFKGETIQALADNFKKHLSSIIRFCAGREERTLTPGDFTFKEVPLETFETIQRMIKHPVKDVYPLTPMQEGMLFHSLYDPNSAAYFVQMSYRLKGDLNFEACKAAINRLFERYDILRTLFIHEGKGIRRPLQFVLEDVEAEVRYKDIRDSVTPGDRESCIRQFREEDRKELFKLNVGPLMRVTIVRLDNEEYEFTWSHHHILMDGWCAGILVNEFFQFYQSIMQNQPPNLPAVIPYSNYFQWLAKQNPGEASRYWSQYLEGYEESARIPRLESGKSAGKDYENRQVFFNVDEAGTEGLNRLAADNNVTLNTLVQVIWGILLSRYAATPDVVFGAVVSGRPSQVEGVESMVGLFINTVPVRVHYDKNTSFLQLLKSVQEDALEGETYHYYPLASIQTQSSLKQNLLDHILVFENFPVSRQIEDTAKKRIEQEDTGKKLDLSGIEGFDQTNYDLNVIVVPGHALGVTFKYNGRIYQAQLLEKIGDYTCNLVKQILGNPGAPVSDLNLMTPGEKEEVLYRFNSSHTDYPRDKTIYQLFAQQVEKTPDNIALTDSQTPSQPMERFDEGLVAEGQTDVVQADGEQEPITVLSYRELDRRVSQLAGILRNKGVTVNSIVGIVSQRSPQVVAAILAVLKAGGCFLPVDHSYPEARKRFVLDDSQAEVVLTTKEIMAREERVFSNISAGNLIFLDDAAPGKDDARGVSGESETPEDDGASGPMNPAYVIYTSGTSGNPKGVVVRNQGLVNYISWAADSYVKNESLHFPLYTSISFDLTITSIFTPLITGNAIVVFEDKGIDVIIERVIKDNRIGVVKLTPTHLKWIIEKQMDVSNSSIKRFIVGGEELTAPVAAGILEKFDGKVQIYNEYGPTETVVGCMIHRYDPAGDKGLSVPIGKPAANTRIYLLDRRMQPTAIGEPGELYIAGDGVAEGYLNREELTVEKFIPEPFVEGGRMYRSGDLGRRLPDGNIQFLGRIDSQVKIRGFRIELEEIEVQLMKHEDIEAAVVIAGVAAGGNPYLCAYIVSQIELSQAAIRLKEYLLKNLPDYMIPAQFKQIEKIPVTANGKIDRKALAGMGAVLGTEIQYAAPENKLESAIVHVWQEVLELEKVGVHDNFFDVGGNSINVIQVYNRIKQDLDMEVPIVTLFEYSTVRALAQYLERKESGDAPEAEDMEQMAAHQDEAEDMMAQTLLALQDSDVSDNG